MRLVVLADRPLAGNIHLSRDEGLHVADLRKPSPIDDVRVEPFHLFTELLCSCAHRHFKIANQSFTVHFLNECALHDACRHQAPGENHKPERQRQRHIAIRQGSSKQLLVGSHQQTVQHRLLSRGYSISQTTTSWLARLLRSRQVRQMRRQNDNRLNQRNR